MPRLVLRYRAKDGSGDRYVLARVGVDAERIDFVAGQEREVFDYYSKNRNALDALRAPVYEDKVVDFLFDKAEVTDRKVTREELEAALATNGGFGSANAARELLRTLK